MRSRKVVVMYTKHLSTICGPAGVAQLVECCPAHVKVAGLIPGQGPYLGFGFSPWSGHIQKATN